MVSPRRENIACLRHTVRKGGIVRKGERSRSNGCGTCLRTMIAMYLLSAGKAFDDQLCFTNNIACDNQQTICLLTKSFSALNTKLRHIDIHGHWLRQEIQAGNIQLRWIGTAE